MQRKVTSVSRDHLHPFRNVNNYRAARCIFACRSIQKHTRGIRYSHLANTLGANLSGGEKRRTEIARALATNPKFVLLDEPFAGVDPIAVEDIQSIIAELRNKNIGILITDHNVQETLSITDRAYLLFEGNILKAGTAEDLASDVFLKVMKNIDKYKHEKLSSWIHTMARNVFLDSLRLVKEKENKKTISIDVQLEFYNGSKSLFQLSDSNLEIEENENSSNTSQG